MMMTKMRLKKTELNVIAIHSLMVAFQTRLNLLEDALLRSMANDKIERVLRNLERTRMINMIDSQQYTQIAHDVSSDCAWLAMNGETVVNARAAALLNAEANEILAHAMSL